MNDFKTTKLITKLHFLLVLFLTFASSLYALPKEEHVPGGLALLHFPSKPKFLQKNKNYCLVKRGKEWVALIPIPLGKINPVDVPYVCNGKKEKSIILVKDKAYDKQYITIKNKKKVTPEKRDYKRIMKEIYSRNTCIASHSKFSPKSFKMIKPIDVALRDDFGRQRFFNNKPRSPHSGTDLSAPKGTKIKAPLAGRVILLGNLYFNGRMVLLDHGQGLVTAYSHLSKIYYPNGTWLEQGQNLGEVGSSGRATGPHLHWSVYLNGVAVNPNLFM